MTERRQATARFLPFAGTLYDDEIVTSSEVVAPPYDVVDQVERKRLAERSPYNAIHLELPEPTSSSDRYEHAAQLLSSWEREGVLRRDDVASFYVYKMQFLDEFAGHCSTLGVIGALDIADDRAVLPHEHTTPKPKDDRLNLLRATRANLSPIWALSPSVGLTKCLENAIDDLPAPISATDDEGVLHELWPIVDASDIEAITALVGENPVLIADGHHRFETARTFFEEASDVPRESRGLIMAYVVELVGGQLHVEAIHRLVYNLAEQSQLLAKAAQRFSIEPGSSVVDDLVRQMDEHGAIGLVSPNGNYLLVDTQPATNELDARKADGLLAELRIEPSYQHGARTCAQIVEHGNADAALLLRPVSVQQIAATAEGENRMPPKTTFFYPKLRTGLVYRTL